MLTRRKAIALFPASMVAASGFPQSGAAQNKGPPVEIQTLIENHINGFNTQNIELFLGVFVGLDGATRRGTLAGALRRNPAHRQLGAREIRQQRHRHRIGDMECRRAESAPTATGMVARQFVLPALRLAVDCRGRLREDVVTHPAGAVAGDRQAADRRACVPSCAGARWSRWKTTSPSSIGGAGSAAAARHFRGGRRRLAVPERPRWRRRQAHDCQHQDRSGDPGGAPRTSRRPPSNTRSIS